MESQRQKRKNKKNIDLQDNIKLYNVCELQFQREKWGGDKKYLKK